jgi:predicted DNA-binding antitoxin AbrB/MazE fold protein
MVERLGDMHQIIEAIYENGAFKPVEPDKISITEGQRVRLVLADKELPESLRLALQVYEGLSQQDMDDIEQIALNRNHFFERPKH